MYASIAILAIAASVALAFEVVAAFHSCDFNFFDWESHMFHLHPNTSELAAVTAMSSALPFLPFLVLIDVWVSAKTHLMKCVVCLGWIVCLFLVEEMILPNVELLPSGVFVAVITLAVFHLLTSLRIHIFAYYALFFPSKIFGFALRFLRSAFRPLIGISCVIMSPLIMHMLIEDVVNPFIHIACQYNIHSFGLFVVGASFMKKILWLTCRVSQIVYGLIAAGANVIVTLCCCIIRSIFFGLIAMGTFFVTSVKKILRYLHRHGQLLSQVVLRPQRRAADTHPVPHRLSVTWSDGLHSDHLSFQPHTDGQSVSKSWYVKSKRNQQRLTKHVAKIRLALSEISRLVTRVSYLDIDPTRYQAFMELNSRVDENYSMESKAECAMEELTLLFDELKQQHPRRFRPWGTHQQLYEECKLFQQGIDILFLEIKLRAEFDANDAIQCVANTMEEAEEEDDEAADPIFADRAEANAPAPLEAPAVELPFPQDDALLPVDNDDFQVEFDNDDGGEEEVEEVEEAAPPVRRRRRRRREVSSLATELGEYWTVTARRRSSRVRREPQWYQP